ncbi:MAG: hypothetical protein DI626_05770 [Micavibrio aeruginosavorus]|uniref:Uncharacterized protein n=1 Tax=Micavibrio aeruginosavorus TaxID=349221 RepID=A0A2W5A0H5_9BACT|nr:MAG: hypothetical protein DI626_05770 [Micavibrio aeruginosavorus]
MASTAQLQEIMNAVSGHLDSVLDAPAIAPVRADDEMAAFLLIDPLLAGLNKQYLDAKSMRRRSEKEYGADDGMTIIAADMEDSAWCAMQTRYMELRNDKAVMKVAKEKMAEEAEREARAKNLEKEEEQRRSVERAQMLEAIEKRNQSDFLFLIIVWYVMMNDRWSIFRYDMPSHSFNRLAA